MPYDNNNITVAFTLYILEFHLVMGLYAWLEEKEGGFWGAVVVLSAFMIQIPSFGTAQSFGIYNMFFLQYFDDSTAAISLIGSINVGVFLGSGQLRY